MVKENFGFLPPFRGNHSGFIVVGDNPNAFQSVQFTKKDKGGYEIKVFKAVQHYDMVVSVKPSP